jgi:polyphenol oxidase
MVHAGWRGTVQRIAAAAVERMRVDFGCKPGDLWVALGPAIGPSAYEVDSPVFEAFEGEGWADWERFILDRRGDRGYLDLFAANRSVLGDCGVPGEQIVEFGLCTHTLSALFFSHRRDGLPGGRMFALGCMLTG